MKCKWSLTRRSSGRTLTGHTCARTEHPACRCTPLAFCLRPHKSPTADHYASMNDEFFRNLEIKRTRAIVERDLDAIERLHAPEYELVTPAGRTFTRARYLAAIAAEAFYHGWEHGPMQVRASSTMAAVRYQARITLRSGRVVECWHTDIYERRSGQWQVVWSQATEIK